MKKRFLCILLCIVLLLGLMPTAMAADHPDFSGTCGEAIQWSLDPQDGILTISGTGAIPNYSIAASAPWAPCSSRIFYVVIEEGVTAIGDYAFDECSFLISVDAEKCTLSAIGECALSNCTSLTEFKFTPAKQLQIGAEAFYNCVALTSLDLSADSGEIGAAAFADCATLSSLRLPKNLLRLERDTFSGCAALSTLTLPKNLTYIGRSCFRGCASLSKLSFPASLTKIDRYAISGYSKFTATFAGDAPDLVAATEYSASIPTDAILRVNYDAKGWTWPLHKGYTVELRYPSLYDTFSDLKQGAWYVSGIQHVYYNKLMTGPGADKFAPDAVMTRGQLVTALYRMAGSPAVTEKNPFTDLAAGAYYNKAVRWAFSNGIVTGKTATIFAPDDYLTREQACTILYRYARLKNLPLDRKDPLTSFVDTDKLGSYARDAVAWCVAEGMINGKPGDLLDPLGTATRAEIAKILTAFDAFSSLQGILAQNSWLNEYNAPDSTLDINREDPLYLYSREVFDEINRKRAASGLNAIRWSDRIYLAAQKRARELTEDGCFGHIRPDGTGYATVFTEFDIKADTRNEIVAHSYTSAKALVDVWASASSTSPVISAVVYSSGAVGIFQLPSEKPNEPGKYYYTLLVVG